MNDNHHDDTVRSSYDTVAEEYARRVYGDLSHKPFDRAILDRFATLAAPVGPICDLGCGPGEIARYLHDRGCDAFGLDISPGMLARARRLNPGISFRQGDITSLPLEDSSLGGMAAFYSLIHVPRPRLSTAFGEMRRTLRPGGVVLVAFHLGDEDRHLDDWWGMSVSIDFLFFRREEIEGYMRDAGLTVLESHERDPYLDVEVGTRRAYILARR